MELSNTIQEYLNEIIIDPQYFVVEIVISGSDRKKIVLLLDGDEGVTIEYCASVSRQLAHRMEEDAVLENAYVLEVSSPGLDHPLMNKRQYLKNIGRNVKVEVEEKSMKGELLEVENDYIIINQQIKEKGKSKILEEEVTIPFKEIKKTKVLVSFK
ncbi:MAG: ribosome maturation factor RimP [Marivirga sp.]|jgi:ribosome maturation factor RimP